jgi:membrane-bound lytic murein transglycosylase B
MPMLLIRLIFSLSLLCCVTVAATPLDSGRVDDFVTFMATHHDFNEQELKLLFSKVSRLEKTTKSLKNPAEKRKTWLQYRDIFLDEARISNGIKFWRANEEALEKAEKIYGVPEHIIVSIIGVETRYGKIQGRYRVLDTLATAAFHYPGGSKRRSKLFYDYLVQYLILCREESFDPLSLTGSYAGAMGMVQFMPTPFRNVAVDFDGDGKKDIWENASDAIGSVANYLNDRGWLRSEPVFSKAMISIPVRQSLVSNGIKTNLDLAQLKSEGIEPTSLFLGAVTDAALYELEGQAGAEYWIGYRNFSTIGKYNPRIKYMMAVAQLSEEILKRWHSMK